MADINFKTQELANLYAYGTNAANQFHLDYFRTTTTDVLKNEIAALDKRIANFQNVITDGAKAGTEDFPYDKAYLKREFMEEVLAVLLKRDNYRAPNALAAGLFGAPVTFNVGGQDLLQGNGFALTAGGTWEENFSNMTPEEHKAALRSGPGEGGAIVYDAYSAWIDAVFAEGNKMKDNPAEVVNVVTSIPARTLPTANSPNVVYDRVSAINTGTKDSEGNPVFRYFLVAQGAPISGLNKVAVTGAFNGEQADSKIVLTANPTVDRSVYIEVDKDLQPLVNGAFGFEYASNNLSPSMYLFYFIEARVRILRGQLNMKEAVTGEIRDDLAKANLAFSDLESQAANTRAQSADGKTVNPDTSPETQNMDFFEATNAKQGTMIYDTSGSDDLHNYGDWGASRSALKAYIDRKSTQSQDAMLEYQTLLNRFNQAYEVMSKIQEKMDGLVKGQLRNV